MAGSLKKGFLSCRPEEKEKTGSCRPEEKVQISLEELAGSVTGLLIENNLTISTMESCTSGLIASLITDTEGASAIFPGSMVTYSNEAKISAGVPAEVISSCGVYSKECSLAMAKAARSHFQTKIAIGVTGNTGNVDPNNTDGIPGIMYYTILFDDREVTEIFSLDCEGLSRSEIKRIYAGEILQCLHRLICTGC